MQIGFLIERLDQLADVARWGYDYAEITPGVLGPDADDPAAEEAARARLRAAGVPAPTLCGFLPDPERLGLMVVGPRVDHGRLRAYATRVFDRMHRAGAELLAFGSGTARSAPAGFPPEQARAQVREFLALCADLAEPRQVRIAIEPQNRTDTTLIHTVPEAVALAGEVGRPSVKVMADFFHVCLNDEPLRDLVEAGAHLIHGHIADPGRGRPTTTAADHAAFFAALRAAGFAGRVTQTGPLPAYPSNDAAATALRALAQPGARA